MTFSSSGTTLAVGAAAVAVGAAVLQSGGTPSTPQTISNTDAARFLTQATFGPNDAAVAELTSLGYDQWFKNQLAAPSRGYLTWYLRRDAAIKSSNPSSSASWYQFQECFWSAAVSGTDQLRQRMTFALSQIMVVSYWDFSVDASLLANFYDILQSNALGNFFDLMKAVSLSSAMAKYLNIQGNMQSDGNPNRHPDQNFARELLQLMTVGLYLLNPDGTPKLDTSGKPIPTYTQADIDSLSNVFTGWGYQVANPTNATFFQEPGLQSSSQPLMAYPWFHSKLAKPLLGTTLPAYTGSGANADVAAYQNAELDAALRIIFNHPNVGPFIATRLIQRFVTSNPSPGYVKRVATVFANNGSGVRGDLFATIRAVLMDVEARGASTATMPSVRPVSDPDYGKLREPTIRIANFLRAFEAVSTSGDWWQAANYSQDLRVNEAPLMAPNVFNFWRPSFSSPGSRVFAKGLVAPEFQIVDDQSVLGWINYVQIFALSGSLGGQGDIHTTYAKELALAPNTTSMIPVAALVDRINLLLCYGSMSPALKATISSVVSGDNISNGAAPAGEYAWRNRDMIQSALILTMSSTDYLIQR